MARIESRLAALQAGEVAPEEWTVPGSHALLDALRQRGLTLYLASGTDLKYVRHEAELLGVADYFGEHIYGALDDYQNFSKQMIIERILQGKRPARRGVAGIRRRLRGDRGRQACRRRGGGRGQRRGHAARRQRLETPIAWSKPGPISSSPNTADTNAY